MIEGIPRISVRVITYKQEELIKRAINSLLAQKDYIYEICVCDDCSPDGTWDVLQQYAKEYPGLFKLHRNEHNLGIFENIEMAWTLPTGDLTYGLAGDDEAGEGWFKTVIEFIQNNNIDYKNELFCIYGDYEGITPDGRRVIHKNNMAISPVNQLSLSLRGIIGNRSACYSINILKKFFIVSKGKSHVAESAQDKQLQLFTEKNYYIPKVGNIYYAGIGVSNNIFNEQTFLERKQINPYLVEQFAKFGYQPTKSDLRYIAYDNAFMDFMKKKSFENACKLFYCWLMAYDPRIGIKSLNLSFVLAHLKKLLAK